MGFIGQTVQARKGTRGERRGHGSCGVGRRVSIMGGWARGQENGSEGQVIRDCAGKKLLGLLEEAGACNMREGAVDLLQTTKTQQ